MDGDGYLAMNDMCGGNDCDDHDPNTHPGAKENCFDSYDNNCDGQINEGCTDDDSGGDLPSNPQSGDSHNPRARGCGMADSGGAAAIMILLAALASAAWFVRRNRRIGA